MEYAALRRLGRPIIGLLADTGAMWKLGVRAGARMFAGLFPGRRIRLRATLEQCVRAGYDSLPLVALISSLVGLIMALQSAYQLRQLGALELIANLVGLAVTREMAPLLTAIIVAGRFGSAVTAELGTMKVSQEIDALVVMGIDPVAFLVLPRLIGVLVALPCLTVFADLVGVLGGLAVGVGLLGLGWGNYLALTYDALALQDIYIGLVKAVVFAAIIGLVGCHQGLSTSGGAEDVGRATTASVVRSIVLVVAADLFVTALFYAGG